MNNYNLLEETEKRKYKNLIASTMLTDAEKQELLKKGDLYKSTLLDYDVFFYIEDGKIYQQAKGRDKGCFWSNPRLYGEV